MLKAGTIKDPICNVLSYKGHDLCKFLLGKVACAAY